MKNPYDWQRHQPALSIPRPDLAAVLDCLRRGGGAFVLGGRGMGKSVFLRQVREELERSPEVQALLFPAPPPELTVRACLEALARKLGVPFENVSDPYELVEEYFNRNSSVLQLVLIYDEFDGYAKSPSDPPGRAFFNSLEAARREDPRIAILTAGSIGVFLFRDVLGSDFLSRASRFLLRPFDPSEARELAAPFTGRGAPLPDDVLDSLHLATGGHPALATYGLQELWDSQEVTSRRVTEIFGRFRELHREFLRDVQGSFADPDLSDAPAKVLDLVWQYPGAVPRAKLQEACRTLSGVLRLDLVDVLDLLQATGLVRVSGAPVTDDPVLVTPIPSILSLPQAISPALPLPERLPHDLEILLGRVHALGADLYRTGAGGRGKELVPESVFSAFLALGLQGAGWHVEREAQSAAGRTDLKVHRDGSDGRGVVEVKIWGRNDYRDVHRQLESYWTGGIVTGAVVMLTDAEIAGWAAHYRQDCIPAGVEAMESKVSGSPVTARFACESITADGLPATIDHFLLRIPRRA